METSNRTAKLAVFSTYGSGLNVWQKVGSLHRELAIYKRLAEKGWAISFYTYDKEKEIAPVGFPAEVYSQRPFLLPKSLDVLYPLLMPILRYRSGRKNSVVITNQAHGGWPAILAGKLWKAKIIARCGMVQGECSEVLGKTSRHIRRKIRLERWTFSKSDICLIPTKELKQWVSDNYGIASDKIFVVPNYVDTDRYRCDENAEKKYDVISIGRLVPKKRHGLLLEALVGSGLRVLIIGSGKLNDELLSFAKANSIDLEIVNRVEHSDLVSYINQSRVFANVSLWEGHPKAVIEAMACGCPSVVTNSAGTSNLIVNEQTGLMVESIAADIRRGIDRLLGDDDLCRQLGRNAREYAVNNFSLNVVTEKYIEILNKCCSGTANRNEK